MATISPENVPAKAAKKPRWSPNLCKPQDIVKITVSKSSSANEEPQEYQVYKEVLCRQSPFFAATFEGAFVEGQTQSMTLDDVGVVEFGVFLHWMHFKEFKTETALAPCSTTLLKLWKLGDRFLVPQLQNEAIDLLHDIATDRYCISWIFGDMVRNSDGPAILQEFVLDALLACDKKQLTKNALQFMKADMMMELVERLKETQGEKRYAMPPKSKYHVKTGDEKDNPTKPADNNQTKPGLKLFGNDCLFGPDGQPKPGVFGFPPANSQATGLFSSILANPLAKPTSLANASTTIATDQRHTPAGPLPGNKRPAPAASATPRTHTPNAGSPSSSLENKQKKRRTDTGGDETH